MIRPFATALLALLTQAIDIENDLNSIAESMEFGEIAAEDAQLFDEISDYMLAQADLDRRGRGGKRGRGGRRPWKPRGEATCEGAAWRAGRRWCSWWDSECEDQAAAICDDVNGVAPEECVWKADLWAWRKTKECDKNSDASDCTDIDTTGRDAQLAYCQADCAGKAEIKKDEWIADCGTTYTMLD